MSETREILTLQFGSYANYVGAHWWNLQESSFNYKPEEGEPSNVNHDVLYREGVNHLRQTTFTPRLLLVDLDGALKQLPIDGELYGNSFKRALHPDQPVEESVKKLKEDLDWKDTEVEVVAQPEVAVNEFQKDLANAEVDINEKDYNLAESVETWADFLYTRYHPRTVHVVRDYKYAPETESFDTYSNGVRLWQTEQFQDDFCEKIRLYVEECDYLQGFQTLFDAFNGFSGVATKCLEHLNDEYDKSNFVLPIYSPRNSLFENADEAMSDSIRVANSALAFSQITETASLFVPLSTRDRVWRQLGAARDLRSLSYQAGNLYQTSAILAAFLDTISLRYRLKDASRSSSLPGFCSDLTNYDRRMAAAAFACPFAMQQDMDLIDCLDQWEGPLFTSLTPNCKVGTDYIVQSLCVRGIPANRLKRPMEKAQKQMQMAAYKCDSVSEMLQLYLQCQNHASLAHVSAIPAPMPTRSPFPRELFPDTLNASGFGMPFGQRPDTEKILSVPTLAAIQSSSELGDTLETLHREAKRIKMAKLHRFKEAGLEIDEYEAALERLLEFKDHYEDNYEL